MSAFGLQRVHAFIRAKQFTLLAIAAPLTAIGIFMMYAVSTLPVEMTPLQRATLNHLVDSKLCDNLGDCAQKIHLYTDEGRQIYVSLYDQPDNHFAGPIAKFYVQQGLDLTDGRPVTFAVFRKGRSEYSFFYHLLRKTRGAAFVLEIKTEPESSRIRGLPEQPANGKVIVGSYRPPESNDKAMSGMKFFAEKEKIAHNEAF